MGVKKRIFISLVICFLLLAGVFLYYNFGPKVIRSNLPRPPIDGERTWAFLVNDIERNPGDVIVVWKSLVISVVELPKGDNVPVDSGEIVDSFDIIGVIQNFDLLGYQYFPEGISSEEALAVVDYHKNGSSTLVFADLQKEEKPWIMVSSISGEIMGRWTILINGQKTTDSFYPYHQGDKILLSIEEIKSGKIVGEADITGDVEEYTQIYCRYDEEGFFIILNTPSDKAFVYDVKEIKVNIFSLTV